MFEFSFEDLTARVYVHSDLYQSVIASNVGVSYELLHEGHHTYKSGEAIEVIKSIDKAFLSAPKYMKVKLRSLRNQFVSAFGPEMGERVGWK